MSRSSLLLLRLAAAVAVLPRLAAQHGPYPACPTKLPRQSDYSVQVLQRSVGDGGGALISQANGNGKSIFHAAFNTAWFPGNGADVSEGLVVRVGAWKAHPEWTSSGALAVVSCNFSTSVPMTGKVTADTVVWPGIRAPAPDERWGALDPRIGYWPETQTYYLAFDNGTDSCGYRQTQLSTSKDPFNSSSWTHHAGQVLGGVDAQGSTAGAGFVFQRPGKRSYAFVATGSNRHMNSEEVIVIAATSETEAGAAWKLHVYVQLCELNATNQCCEDFTSRPCFDGPLRPENATCISENCCSKRPQCLAGVTEPRYCNAPKLGGMQVGEGCDIELQCPPGQKIRSILFADWGLPVATGGAGPTEPSACTFRSQLNCTSADATKALVTKLCVGKNACTISTANTHDPNTVNEVDPCHSHHKRLAVAATGCSAAPPPTPPHDPKLGRQVLITPRPTCWDRGGICAGPSPQQLSNGDWLYVYDHDSHVSTDVSGRCSVGWSILDRDDPSIVVARGAEPMLTATLPFEMHATPNLANSSGTANVVFADGLRPMGDDRFAVIFGAADTDVGAALIQVNVKPAVKGEHPSLKLDDHVQHSWTMTDCICSSNATAAVHGLLHRMLPGHVTSQFHVEHCPLDPSSDLVDFFELLPGNSSAVVHIRGSSGVAMASGVHHYLRRYANTSFSWWGDNLANLPAVGQTLPSPPAGGVRRNTTLKYRYALNSCVFGYSTPYWDLARWIREIDLMAVRESLLALSHDQPCLMYPCGISLVAPTPPS